MKPYVKYLIKHYIPFYVVSFAITLSLFFSYFSSMTIFRTVSNGPNYYYSGLLDSGVIVLGVPIFIITMIAPILANTYRYSIKAADTFYQIGKGERAIRYTNNAVLLISSLISYTIPFIIAILLLLIRQLVFNGRVEIVSESVTRYYVIFNFGYYAIVYLIYIVFGILNYFISYFFVTRANNAFNSIIMLLFGQIIMGIGIMTPIWVLQILNAIEFDSTYLLITRTSTFVSAVALCQNIFNSLIVDGTVSSTLRFNFDGLSLALAIICMSVYVIVGVLSILCFIKEKETSGEYAGKPRGRNSFQEIIFNMGFGLIGLWIGIGTVSIKFSTMIALGFISLVSAMCTYGAVYYVFTGITRRNFKLSRREVIILLSVIASNIIASFVIGICIYMR